jgi:hypothetical protein
MRISVIATALLSAGLIVAGPNFYAHAADAPSARTAAKELQELHFVTVLKVSGKVVSVNPSDATVTIAGPNGKQANLQARDLEKLEGIKAGDQVNVTYIEGARIRKKASGEDLPAVSLKEGLIESQSGAQAGRHRSITFVSTIDRIDQQDQEVTLKGPDGSEETVMVENPDDLAQLKPGDQIVISHYQALALGIAPSDAR